jgi:hypothetical protein
MTGYALQKVEMSLAIGKVAFPGGISLIQEICFEQIQNVRFYDILE